MISLVEERKGELADICRRFGVRRLDLFGSAAIGTFKDETSDLDFAVDFADRSPGYADRYLAFAEALEALFERQVDLLTERAIRDQGFRRSVDDSRRTVYDARDDEAAA